MTRLTSHQNAASQINAMIVPIRNSRHLLYLSCRTDVLIDLDCVRVRRIGGNSGRDTRHNGLWVDRGVVSDGHLIDRIGFSDTLNDKSLLSFHCEEKPIARHIEALISELLISCDIETNQEITILYCRNCQSPAVGFHAHSLIRCPLE